MAILSRREDGGIYTRINIGGIATKQVHPDAVRYLNKRNIYVGDEIPSELMKVLRKRKMWLYTKEEYPFVVFSELSEPAFGERPHPNQLKRRTKKEGVNARALQNSPIVSNPKGRKKSNTKSSSTINYSVQGGIESKATSRRRNDLFEQDRVERFRAKGVNPEVVTVPEQSNISHSWSEPYMDAFSGPMEAVIPSESRSFTMNIQRALASAKQLDSRVKENHHFSRINVIGLNRLWILFLILAILIMIVIVAVM